MDNQLDLDLFRDILSIDSTSGKERWLAEYLCTRLLEADAGAPGLPACTVRSFEVGDGTLNLLFSWGEPQVYFCTHLDTVPPYIPPVFLPDRVLGRGSCDAKGQLFSMFTACRALEKKGLSGFALLLLAGEETGSFGAKAYNRDCPGGAVVIVGEPTDNCMVSASKGTRSFGVTIHGTPCHSGYPEFGKSAVDGFVDFMQALRGMDFPEDPLMGATTWNVGRLVSDNPQNILSPEVRFRLYFRTTSSSADAVVRQVMGLCSDTVEIEDFGGDTPMTYFTQPGIPSKTVAFGSDAPRLEKFTRRAICGPGSILCAHRDEEHILLKDIEIAVDQYVRMAEACFSLLSDKTNLT